MTQHSTRSRTAAIALGSNLGDRRDHLVKALERLDAHPALSLVAHSSHFETAPMYVLDQPSFVNACALYETELDAHALLELLLEVERELGRVREIDKGPRTIDLDLILLGDLVVDDPPALVLPHPAMHERRFVLEPLAQIGPRLRHPILEKTVAELLDALAQEPQ